MELKQLNGRGVMEPINGNNMSREENKASLQYLMFLKQKLSINIKGRKGRI